MKLPFFFANIIISCNFAAVLTAIRMQRYALFPKYARKNKENI